MESSPLSGVFHEEYPKVLAAMIRLTGDFQLAEDCTQDAFASALQKWGFGVPERPGAWLTAVARNRAIDHLRRENRWRDKAALLALQESEGEGELAGDRLRLFFTCCHPALPIEAQIALTLRTLGGLTTAQIARAFLVPESTMAQRLVRSKRKIKTAGIPYQVPPPEQLAERLDSVLSVIYLIFNEGYLPTEGPDLTRPQLSDEAIQLARILREEMPGEAEVAGLLALILFHGSRRKARISTDGELVTMEDQDRSLWDRTMIAEGRTHLAAARDEPRGRYAVEAAIAYEHCRASAYSATDWATIAELYEELVALTDSSVVRLNHAVAVAFAHGAEEGLSRIETLKATGELEDYHLLHSTEGTLLIKVGRKDEGLAALGRAYELTRTDAERKHIQKRMRDI